MDLLVHGHLSIQKDTKFERDDGVCDGVWRVTFVSLKPDDDRPWALVVLYTVSKLHSLGAVAADISWTSWQEERCVVPERSIGGLEKSRVEKWEKWGKNPRVGLLVLTGVPTGPMSTWISRAPARRSRPTPQPPHTPLYAVDGAGVRQRKRARCLRDVASNFSLAAPFGNSSHRFSAQHKRCRMRHV